MRGRAEFGHPIRFRLPIKIERKAICGFPKPANFRLILGENRSAWTGALVANCNPAARQLQRNPR